MRRRAFITAAGATIAAATALALPRHSNAAPAGLVSMTGAAKPISVEERRARIARLQQLMGEQRIGALIMESGPAWTTSPASSGAVRSAPPPR